MCVAVDLNEAHWTVGPHLEALLVVYVRRVAAKLYNLVLVTIDRLNFLGVSALVSRERYLLAEVLFADFTVIVLIR